MDTRQTNFEEVKDEKYYAIAEQGDLGLFGEELTEAEQKLVKSQTDKVE